MTESAPTDRRGAWVVSTLLLLYLLLYLVVRSEASPTESKIADPSLWTRLTVIWVSCYAAWRTLGGFCAFLAVVLLSFWPLPNPGETWSLDRLHELQLLLILSTVLVQWSLLAGATVRVRLWSLLGLSTLGMGLMGWLLAGDARASALPGLDTDWARLRVLSLGLLAATTLVGGVCYWRSRQRHWGNLIATCLVGWLAPAVGMSIGWLWKGGNLQEWFTQGDWASLPGNLQAALVNPGPLLAGQATWTLHLGHWLIVPMMLGLWSMLVRGVAQLRRRQLPDAWLLLLFGLGVLGVELAYQGEHPVEPAGPLGLVLLPPLLSLAAVSGLFQWIYVRLRREPQADVDA